MCPFFLVSKSSCFPKDENIAGHWKGRTKLGDTLECKPEE